MEEHLKPPARSLPSTNLDVHYGLHEQAAEFVTGRHGQNVGNSGNHDDDLMTPPDVLLKRALDDCREHTQSNHELALDGWVRCTALARIVHGDSHWILADTHIQLGLEYLKKGLNEQALAHACKGQEILLSPGCHALSHDQSPESTCSLSLAHYISGCVFISQERLADAERSLLKAEKTLKKYHTLPGGKKDVQFELNIVLAVGRLHLRKNRFIQARDCFQKAIDLCKAEFGSTDKQLIDVLKCLAIAHLKVTSDSSAPAVEALEEALKIAESISGPTSDEVGNTLLSLARAHSVGGAEEAVESCLMRAHSVFSSLHGQHHEKAISCKNELCNFLAVRKVSQKKTIPLLKEVISEKETLYGVHSIEVGKSLKLLGAVYLAQAEVNEAIKTLEKAKLVYSSLEGANSKEVLRISSTLERITPHTAASKARDSRPKFKTIV